MASMGVFLSACEQRANRAERDLATTKRCRFLLSRLGEVFEGMVTGVAKFGFFVQLKKFDVDGLVKLERLHFDRFEFDDENMLLRGRKTGHTIKLGDKVTVQVARVDAELRQIDFEFLSEKYQSKATRSIEDFGEKVDALIKHGKTNQPDFKDRRQAPADRRDFGKTWLSQRPGKSKAGPVSPKASNKKRRARKPKRR